MAALLPPLLKFQPLDANGNPVPGGKVYTYSAGTSTPLATYGSDGVTPNTNLIVLDANGACDMRLNPVQYKINVVDSSDVQVSNWPVDNISTPTADFSQQTVTKGAYLIGFIQNETGAEGRTVADKLYEMPVSITEFGAVGGGADDSAAFASAIATGRHVLVPTGTWKASFTLDNDGQMLVGEGSNNSKITPANSTTGIVVDALRVSIKGLTVIAYDDFTGKLVDCDGVTTSPRYLDFYDLTIRQDVSALDTTASDSASCLLSVVDDSFFTGYNTFRQVRTRGGTLGWQMSGLDIASATSIENCSASWAGTFGMKLERLSNVTIRTMDVASNGTAATAGTDRSATHGGIYIGGASRNVIVSDIYCEYNCQMYDGFYTPNNVYVTADCTGVDVINVRDIFGTNVNLQTAVFNQVMGEHQGMHYVTEYTRIPGGVPAASNKNMLINPRFRQRNSSGQPYGYIISGSGLWSYITTDHPIGFEGCIVLDPNSTTGNQYRAIIYDNTANTGPITDIAAMAGQTITAATWFKLTDVASDIATSDVVIGISNNASMGGTRQNMGRLVFADKWILCLQRYVIAGTETTLRIGAAVVNPKCKLRIAGQAYCIGNSVPSFDSAFKFASATFDPASLTVGTTGAVQTLTVTGVSLGDIVTAAFSLDHQGITFPSWVSAADTISYFAHNPSGNPVGTVNLASGTIRFHIKSPVFF